MANARGNYADNQVLHGGDLNADLTTLLGNDAAALTAVLAGWNWLISGGALTPGSGYSFTVAAATVAAQGVIATLPLTTLAVGGNSSGVTRTDLVVATLTQNAPDGNNPSTGNPVVNDSWALSVVPGAPGKATLAANQVQLGSVAVPNGAGGIGSCTLNSADTSPNSQGPLKSFLDVRNHQLANATSTNSVHGIQQGSGHAFDADSVDGIHASGFDAAGAASGVQTNLNTETTNRTAADTVLQTNITNEATARQSGDTGVQGNLNTHTGESLYTQIVHGEESRRGHVTGISITGGNGFGIVAHVTFSPAMAGTPQNVQLTMDQGNAGGAPPVPQNVTANGFDIAMSTAGTYNGGVYWRADS